MIPYYGIHTGPKSRAVRVSKWGTKLDWGEKKIGCDDAGAKFGSTVFWSGCDFIHLPHGGIHRFPALWDMQHTSRVFAPLLHGCSSRGYVSYHRVGSPLALKLARGQCGRYKIASGSIFHHRHYHRGLYAGGVKGEGRDC